MHVHITDRVSGKQIYLPLNDNSAAAINYLTSSVTDPETHTRLINLQAVVWKS